MQDLGSALRESLDSRFSTWMLRPYLDLKPTQVGPSHVGSIEAGWQALELSSPPFRPQRALSPGFRKQVAELAGNEEAILDPRELAAALRSDRWQRLCQMLDGWSDLSPPVRCRLASLLHSLCFYDLLVKLLSECADSTEVGDPITAQLAFYRASAAFMRSLPGRVPGYQFEIMSSFEALGRSAETNERVRFDACAMVVVQLAKSKAPLPELVNWGTRLERAYPAMNVNEENFESGLLKSRLYRAMGFIPMHGGDKSSLVRIMDAAECHARELQPHGPAEQILYRENLHAVLESRTKEALWLNDLDLAESRASELTGVDPYDSKAWVELGQVRYLREKWREALEAYATSTILGPPAGTVGRYMSAVCLRKLGLDTLAAFLFKETLELDPRGISARQEIFELPDTDVTDALKSWARITIML